jgi:hypothetical protein
MAHDPRRREADGAPAGKTPQLRGFSTARGRYSGGVIPILGWCRGARVAPKLISMSWSRGAEVEPAKESLYAEFLGTEWLEVEPGIFIQGETAEAEPPFLRTAPVASS